MKRRAFVKNLGLVAISAGVLVGNNSCVEGVASKESKIQDRCAGSETFVLWQLPALAGTQMNSYVMKTVNDKIIVIDGGYDTSEASYLKGFLAALGNHVDMWFISHQHLDHVNALIEILKKPGNLKIDKIYGSLLDEKWIEVHENVSLETAVRLNEALNIAKKQVVELQLGQILKIDGVTIEIIGIKNPEIIVNGGNNSSVVMRVWDTQKSILFTGDLGIEGGDKLLASKYKDRLRSDYIQMAHHGQHGTNKDFYKAVGAKYCIWPTPIWLWNNDSGEGKGSGSWQTLEVREWMDELGVIKHYCLFDGLQKIK
jgi:hypothetical protein